MIRISVLCVDGTSFSDFCLKRCSQNETCGLEKKPKVVSDDSPTSRAFTTLLSNFSLGSFGRWVEVCILFFSRQLWWLLVSINNALCYLHFEMIPESGCCFWLIAIIRSLPPSFLLCHSHTVDTQCCTHSSCTPKHTMRAAVYLSTRYRSCSLVVLLFTCPPKCKYVKIYICVCVFYISS